MNYHDLRSFADSYMVILFIIFLSAVIFASFRPSVKKTHEKMANIMNERDDNERQAQ